MCGLLSNLMPANEQSATLGVARGAGRRARTRVPIFSATTLHYVPPLPYLTGAAVQLVTAVVFAKKMGQGAQPVVAGETAGTPK